MPITRLADIVEPDVWKSYIIERSMELTEVLTSGIMTNDPYFDQVASGPNTIVNMPFFQDLSGDLEPILDTGFFDPGKITTSKDIAVKQAWGRSFGANGLSALLSGADPYNAILELLSQYWARKIQEKLLLFLDGVFNTADMSSKTLDISGLAGDLANVDGNNFLDAAQLLGDAKSQLTAVLMHSAMETWLTKLQLVQYEPTADKKTPIRTFLNKRIVVDDAMPYDPTTRIGSLYLFAPGAVAFGNGTHPRITPIETVREGMALSGEDYVVTRRVFLFHVYGLKWTGLSVTGDPFPVDADISNPANYERVYDPKRIGLVRMIAKAGERVPVFGA